MAIKNKMNQGSGIMTTDEAILMASQPDPMDARNDMMENIAIEYFGKPLKSLSEDEIIQIEEMLENMSMRKRKAKSIKMAEGYSPGDYDPLIVEEYEKYKYDAEEQGQPVISIDEFLRLARTEAMGGGLMRMKYAGGSDDYNPGKMTNPAVMTKIENMREEQIMNPDVEDVADYKTYYMKKKKQDDEIKRLEDMIKKARREKAKRTKGGVASILGE